MKTRLSPLIGLLLAALFVTSIHAGKPTKPPEPPPSANPVIAFGVGADLWVMDADGANSRRVLRWAGYRNILYPQWSPDGNALFYYGPGGVTGENRGIYCTNLAGTEVIGPLVLAQAKPIVSPGPMQFSDEQDPPGVIDLGAKIAFVYPAGAQFIDQTADMNLPTNNDIYLMNLDGSGLINLTNTPDIDECGPMWAPGSDRIAVRIYGPQEIPGQPSYLLIYHLGYETVGIDPETNLPIHVPAVVGVEQVDDGLLRTPYGDQYPYPTTITSAEWANTMDAFVLKYVRYKWIDGGSLEIKTEFWILNLEAGSMTPLHAPELEINPAVSWTIWGWSPLDSHVLLTVGGDRAMNGIYKLMVDGSGLQKLIGGEGYAPSWYRYAQ